ncbi:MAG TPA: hypothetical protein VEZ90_11825, partial [Blastocatellia bacterium]|nr:hypothetical protein [Blastocatellia bacterium]
SASSRAFRSPLPTAMSRTSILTGVPPSIPRHRRAKIAYGIGSVESSAENNGRQDRYRGDRCAASEPSDIELFDDSALADSIAAITRNNPAAAEELTQYLLVVLDGLGETAT